MEENQANVAPNSSVSGDSSLSIQEGGSLIGISLFASCANANCVRPEFEKNTKFHILFYFYFIFFFELCPTKFVRCPTELHHK